MVDIDKFIYCIITYGRVQNFVITNNIQQVLDSFPLIFTPSRVKDLKLLYHQYINVKVKYMLNLFNYY